MFEHSSNQLKNIITKKSLMSLPHILQKNLKLPAVAAPLFIVSNPKLVIESCKAGIVGSFPALNQRTSEGFEQWLIEITTALSELSDPAPYAVNLIVHKSNPRLQVDLELCVKYKVPIIITSLGAVSDVVNAVHEYGGLVFHDVINKRHAKKAASVGVDGLIAVCAGAGGHAGTLSPFSLVNEIRQFFDKTILLSGVISTGQDIAAAQMLGADLAYLGTRFIATTESAAGQTYKDMLVDTDASDIMYTAAISGVNANFLTPSIIAAGKDPKNLEHPDGVDFGSEFEDSHNDNDEPKPWKDIWSAGQGVGSIDKVMKTSELVEKLISEYQTAVSTFKAY